MASELLNFAYTIGTIDVAQDITPGTAQTSFQDYSTLSSGALTQIVVTQGSKRAYMIATKTGAILRPTTYVDGTNGVGASVTFDAGTVTVFTDLGRQHLVYIDAEGNAVNADAVFRTFSPELLTDLKTVPIPATGKSAAMLQNILAGDQKGALYIWDPDETATGDDFAYVVSTLSATGRWVRQVQQLEVSAEGADSEAISSSIYRVANDLRHKRTDDVVKKIPLAEGYHQNEYVTFAAWQAIASSKWADGDTFVFRGIIEENDLNGERLTFTWDASSTNTTALGVTQLRPDDISGSNPGRAVLVEPAAMSKLTNSDATPSLAGGRFHRCADTVPAAITALDDMVDLQTHWIFPGAQDQVFTHSASLVCPRGIDFKLQTTDSPIAVISDNDVVYISSGGGGSGVTTLAEAINAAATYTVLDAGTAGKFYTIEARHATDPSIRASARIYGDATSPEVLVETETVDFLEFAVSGTNVQLTNTSASNGTYNIVQTESF